MRTWSMILWLLSLGQLLGYSTPSPSMESLKYCQSEEIHKCFDFRYFEQEAQKINEAKAKPAVVDSEVHKEVSEVTAFKLSFSQSSIIR